GMDPVGADAGTERASVVGDATGTAGRRRAVDAALQRAEEALALAAVPDEPVVEHLRSKGSLVVEHDWLAQQAGDDAADQRALVQVAVDDIGPEGERLPEGLDEQGDIQIRLVAG